MRRERLGLAVVTALSVLLGTGVPVGAATLKLNDVCGPATVLSLVGVDTSTGRALFRVKGAEPGPPVWLLELGPAGRETDLVPDWTTARRFSGSTGPGPVLVMERCGDGCGRVMAWSAELDWRPLGESLEVAETQTVHLTWDDAGAPWVVLHEASKEPGRVRATAFRGAERAVGDFSPDMPWDPRGSLIVRSVGSPALLPDPGISDAVLTGTGRFRGAGEPEGWLRGLPAIPDVRRGQVIPSGSEGVFYLAGDGAVYLSDDGGDHWRAVTWTPWSEEPAEAGPWKHGVDYSLDRPAGTPAGALELVWFDDRTAGAETVVLSAGDMASWRVVATLSPDLEIAGRRHPLEHILRLGSSWLVIGGCASPAEGAGLVLRTVEGGVVSATRLAPFAPSWLGE